MGQDSKIEWTKATANLWWGCTEVHAGCDRCYARTFARAKGKASAWEGARFSVGSIWDNLAKWEAGAAGAGRVDRVFTGSMMDIFEKSLPALSWSGEPTGMATGDLRDRYFREVVPTTPHLMHLLLTKRPGNIPRMVPPGWLKDWPANVMSGTSVVNQATADTLIPQLLDVPGMHFLSMEPLLGPVDLSPWLRCPECHGKTWDRVDVHNIPCPVCDGDFRPVEWVILGGESGPGARPMHPDWARSIRDQCQAAGVPFFFKQWGEWAPAGSRGRHCFNPGSSVHDLVTMDRVGKKIAGRMLDGRTWDQFPTPAPAPMEARS